MPTAISFSFAPHRLGRAESSARRDEPYSPFCAAELRYASRSCPPRPPRRRPREHFMSYRTKPPQADGLYDPRFEHDACGVAMVARLDNRPTHDVVDRALDGARQPRAPRRRGRRHPHRRRRRDPHPDARRVLPRGRRLRAAAARRSTASASASCRATRRAARKLEQLLELNVRVEGQRVLGWRDVRSTSDARRRHGRPPRARASASCSSRAGPGFDRRPGRLRAQALRDPPDRRARRRPRLLRPELLVAHAASTRGC